ncbi:hypothetical protein C4J81_11475 [Deltaproteobacteria bacterium Smac51]|nr:hypothetical protein C4J81_11475 [Deltaproteobacteria bacterium Smac51]
MVSGTVWTPCATSMSWKVCGIRAARPGNSGTENRSKETLVNDTLANVICAFVPSKRLRKRLRDVFKFGLRNYFTVMREESGLEFEHYLSVCAIAKNEGPYFKEWLEFHRLAGVDKFYIYDNESSDNTREILEPYIQAGIVEYTFWPGQRQQIFAYTDCLKKHKYDTRWLAFIDMDEFMVPVETRSLREVLEALPPDASQLLAGWMVYGSDGHETRPDGLVTQNYKRRMPDGLPQMVKAIIKPRMFFRVSIHFNKSVIRGKTVDANGTEIILPSDRLPPPMRLPQDKIRINHYHCKSWEEYQLRRARGDAAEGSGHKYTRKLFDELDHNEVFDPIMESYAEALEEAVALQPGPVSEVAVSTGLKSRPGSGSPNSGQ